MKYTKGDLLQAYENGTQVVVKNKYYKVVTGSCFDCAFVNDTDKNCGYMEKNNGSNPPCYNQPMIRLITR